MRLAGPRLACEYLTVPPAPQRVVDPLLARAWNLTGLAGKPPPVFSYAQKGVYGSQPHASRRVYLDPRMMRDLRGLAINPARGMRALDVLLHEYAHVGQPTVFKPDLVEGGAVLWSQ